MKNKNLLILAPHVDDELIGCYTLFRLQNVNIEVHYFEELDSERRAEAEEASLELGFKCMFAEPGAEGYKVTKELIDAGNFDQVYCPSRADLHDAHRRINSEFRSRSTHFYSVDMSEGSYTLSADGGYTSSWDKLRLLNKLYPSQKALWETNAKYYLFENIREHDFSTYVTINIGPDAKVRVLDQYQFQIKSYVEEASRPLPKGHSILDVMSTRDLFDTFVSICKYGKVTLEVQSIALETP